jgi:hypothetical protein
MGNSKSSPTDNRPAESSYGSPLQTGTDKPTTFGNTVGAGLSPFGSTYEKYQAKDFNKWQLVQAKNLRARGESADLENEKQYIEQMIKAVLRGYVCHREVDTYTECLVRNKIVDESEMNTASVNMRQANAFCSNEVEQYTGCMGKKQNYDTIVEAATGHGACEDLKVDLQICLERTVEREDQEKNCMRPYYTLLRCGLNSMFDDYWKKVSSFGTLDEMHLFEVEQDHHKQAAVRTMKKKYE